MSPVQVVREWTKDTQQPKVSSSTWPAWPLVTQEGSCVWLLLVWFIHSARGQKPLPRKLKMRPDPWCRCSEWPGQCGCHREAASEQPVERGARHPCTVLVQPFSMLPGNNYTPN